ncbi:MAG: beta-lactamase family protein [Planctomycetes bacterium]|nr:beta-lactamase family protein [Planctomycetota bacterium]
MRILNTWLSTILLATISTAQSLPTDAIAERANAHVGKNKNVGIAIGIRSGDVRWTKGFGRVSNPDGDPPDEHTLFEIGSISKVFNGILLADRVLAGELTLDDDVQASLPEGVTVPRGEHRAITLLDLATHRSGLPRMPSNFRPKDGADPYADYDANRLYEELADCRLSTEPGESYEYSNLGAALLGHAIALDAGRPYAELLTERVLEPLGLESTGIGLGNGTKRLAPVHDGLGRPAQHWNFDVFAPAGALRSSVADLLLFVDANLGLRAADSSKVLAFAREVRVETEPPLGLGWHVMRIGELGIWWHNGGTGGSRSFLAVCPDRQVGIVVLSNSERSVDDLAIESLRALLEPARSEPEVTPR